jgi:hypothetical protein
LSIEALAHQLTAPEEDRNSLASEAGREHLMETVRGYLIGRRPWGWQLQVTIFPLGDPLAGLPVSVLVRTVTAVPQELQDQVQNHVQQLYKDDEVRLQFKTGLPRT